VTNDKVVHYQNPALESIETGISGGRKVSLERERERERERGELED
jgi:hypothetical protein